MTKILEEQPKVDDKPLKLCRLCGNDLSGSARRIGVCVWCVASNKYQKVTIPKPKYGVQDG